MYISQKYRKKGILSCLLWMSGLVILCIASFSAKAKEKEFVIVLDPGHGGEQSGAEREENGREEKDLNLKIGLYLRDELEKLQGVRVVMTREEDITLDKLPQRTQVSVDADADLMVSLHNNAGGSICEYRNGCNVLASEGLYRPELGQEEQELACCILQELSKLGIEDQGILLRESQSGDTYPNGEIADYYGLVRSGVKVEIPTIIVEHAFLDHDGDYEAFLSDDDKLRELARADARGIARYYQLKDEKGETLEPLSNIREKVFVIVDEDYHHNRVGFQTFFLEDDENRDEKINLTNGDRVEKEKDCEIIIKKIKESFTKIFRNIDEIF